LAEWLPSSEGSKFGWSWLIPLLRHMAYTTTILPYGRDIFLAQIAETIIEFRKIELENENDK